MKNKLFEEIKEKLNKLDNEQDKDKMKELIVDMIVDLEKFCHKDDVNIHMVLHDARERCKKEIKKAY